MRGRVFQRARVTDRNARRATRLTGCEFSATGPRLRREAAACTLPRNSRRPVRRGSRDCLRSQANWYADRSPRPNACRAALRAAQARVEHARPREQRQVRSRRADRALAQFSSRTSPDPQSFCSSRLPGRRRRSPREQPQCRRRRREPPPAGVREPASSDCEAAASHSRADRQAQPTSGTRPWREM